MDTNNWRSTPPSGEPTTDTGDWRTQLQPDSRQRIVNKIMDTLKRHLPFSGQEGLNELRKIAVRFEEKIFTAASSQSDYLRRISLKMLTLETKSQNTITNTGNGSKSPDPDSTTQTGHANGGDWQEEVYQKTMKETYSPELNEMYQKISAMQQNLMDSNNWRLNPPSGESSMDIDDWRTQLQPDSRQRIVNKIMDTLKRHLPFSSQEGLNELRTIVVRFEEKIFTEATSQPDYLRRISLKMLQMEAKSQNTAQNSGKCSNLQDPASIDAAVQTEHATGDDWQEEVYHKIKAMEEKYLPELNEIYQKIAAKLQQYDSLLQQPKTGQLDELKIFKTTLERILAFLSVSKCHILPIYQVKLDSYEKQIINYINANRPSKLVSVLQPEQLSSANVLSIQQWLSQIDLSQSDNNQMNPQSQSMMPQGFEPTPTATQILMQRRQQQQQVLPHHMQDQQRLQQQYLHQLAKPQPLAKIKTHELPQLHEMNGTDDMNTIQGIGISPGLLQENLPSGRLPGYSHEQSKPGAQFLVSSPLQSQSPFVPSTSTLLTPSSTAGNSKNLNYSAEQATGEQEGSERPAPDTPYNGMAGPPLLAGLKNANITHGNALTTDCGKSNVANQPHGPRVTMAKPMSLKSLSTSVVTMVDEAAAAVGEDLTAVRKRGLHARNFFTQIGLSGAQKMRCYMSAIVTLALIFWCIFFLNHQN